MKKVYEIPELKVIALNMIDVLTASLGDDQPAEEDKEWEFL